MKEEKHKTSALGPDGNRGAQTESGCQRPSESVGWIRNPDSPSQASSITGRIALRSVALACIAVVCIGLSLSLYHGLLEPPTDEPPIEAERCWTAAEIARSFDGWEGLTKQERMAVVQAYADRESVRLGLTSRPVAVAAWEPSDIWGVSYDRYFVVNEGHLMEDWTGWEIARAVAHEVFHLFQHAILDDEVDLPETDIATSSFPDEQTVDEWKQDRAQRSDSYIDYWFSSTEQSARAYAWQAERRLKTESYRAGYEPERFAENLMLDD